MKFDIIDFMIFEIITSDHRYSDISQYWSSDEDRFRKVKSIISYVRSNANHEIDFVTFVNIKLDEVYNEMID